MILNGIKRFFLILTSGITVLRFKLKVKLKRVHLTPKGECLCEYCKKIVDGSLLEKDIIEEYERCINLMMRGVVDDGDSATREEKAELICKTMAPLMQR